MNTNLRGRKMRFGTLIVLAGWAPWASAAPKPTAVAHSCEVTVADRPGDSIRSDGLGAYLEGVDGTTARIWDMASVADHLTFWSDAGGTTGRSLSLSIPGVTGGTQTCASGKLMPNRNANNYQFYNNLPVGSSTDMPSVEDPLRSNFGGTFECYFGPGNRDHYQLTYESECIVIAHTADKEWTITADAGCQATVIRVENRKVKETTLHEDVLFKVTARELP